MKYAPVAMFVYDREDHFRKTYDALAQNNGAGETELFVFSDGAKDGMSWDKVDAVRTAVNVAAQKKDFKSVTVIESEKNKGLAASIISGVGEVLERYGRVIVVEDDCVTSQYFLDFMNSCLDRYESDETVGAIAGYSPRLSFPEDFKDDVFTAYRSCSWTWATWKRSFEDVDWGLENIDDFYRDPELIKKLNANGSDRFIRLYRQSKGDGSSWSVRFGAHLVRNGLLTIYPRYSYVSNIGCDESGVHSKSEDAKKMSVDLSRAIKEPRLVSPHIDERVQKIMKKHYSGGIISDVKRALAVRAVLIKNRRR